VKGVEKAREEVVNFAHIVSREGLCFSTWGNLSCRPEKDRTVITPSGIPYEDLQPADMIVLNLDGVVEEGRWKPSTELPLHLEIYKAREDVKAIIHTHSKYATAFAVARREIAPATEEMAQLFGGSVPAAEYAFPGSQELAVHASRALGKSGFAVLLANHGTVCVGASLAEALLRARVIERSAEILLWSTLLGDPFLLSNGETSKLRDLFLKHYGQEE